MSLALLYGLAGIALVAMGLYAALAARHVLRRLLGLNVLGSGVFMMLVALASRSADSAERPDPVPLHHAAAAQLCNALGCQAQLCQHLVGVLPQRRRRVAQHGRVAGQAQRAGHA